MLKTEHISRQTSAYKNTYTTYTITTTILDKLIIKLTDYIDNFPAVNEYIREERTLEV